MSAILYKPLSEFRTQKARGVAALARFQDSIYSTNNARASLVYPYDQFPCEPGEGKIAPVPIFVRPCPTTPRHGFAESKLAFNHPGFDIIMKAAMKLDKNAEFLLAPYIPARWSAVINRSSITIGQRNDGATKSKECITLPLPSNGNSFANQHLVSRVIHTNETEALGITGDPFLEIVYDMNTGKAEIVQIRDGHAPPSLPDYVPRKTKVKKVLSIGYTLLSWETLTAAHKGIDGVVVSDVGGSVSSHYGQHAIINGIPYITSHLVSIGETLEASGQVLPKSSLFLNNMSVRLRRDMDMGLGWLINMQRYLGDSRLYTHGVVDRCTYVAHTLLLAAHHHNLWASGDRIVRLLSKSIVSFIWLTACALAGELRHWKGSGPPRWSKDHTIHPDNLPKRRITKYPTIPTKILRLHPTDRDQVYMRYLLSNMKCVRGLIDSAILDFSNDFWSPDMGGYKWAECAKAAKAFLDTVDSFVSSPTLENWNNLNMRWHEAINIQHNGESGMLGKFTTTHNFTVAANFPVPLAMMPKCLETINEMSISPGSLNF